MRPKVLIACLILLFFWVQPSFQDSVIASVAVPGSGLVQTSVEVSYADGTTEKLFFQSNDLDVAFADGLNFYLSFDGSSTFPDPSVENWAIWTFTSTKSVKTLGIDLSTSNSAFDSGNLAKEPSIQTLRSANGLPLQILNATPAFSQEPVISYGGIPDVDGRQEDLWKSLNLDLAGYSGTFLFRAGAVKLAPNRPPYCTSPFIQATGNLYPPYLLSSLSPIFVQNGKRFLRLDVAAVAAAERRSGIEPTQGTWITFATPENTGCKSGIDYQWTHSRTSDSNNLCLDIYSLELSLDIATDQCNMISGNDSSVLAGVLNIRTTVDNYESQTSSYSSSSLSSQISFTVNLSNASAYLNLTVSGAPVEASGIIYQYSIPNGEDDKIVYVQTFIQNPSSTNRLRLVYNPSVSPVDRIASAEYVSDPTFTDNRVSENWQELSSGCEFQYRASSDGIVELCTQRWMLTISIASAFPPVCILTDVFFLVPFEIVCDSPACQALPNDSSTSLTIHVNTDNFCPVVLADYSFLGSITPYLPDFSQPHLGFFRESQVGFEIRVEDTLDSSIESSISSIRITYLAAIIGDGLSPSDLFPPNIYTFLRGGGTGAILVGADPAEGFPDQFLLAGLESNVCDLYPQNGSTGCLPNVLRFRFYIRDSLWPIPLDEFRNLRVGVLLDLDLGFGVKKTVWTQSSNPNDVSTWASLTVRPVAVVDEEEPYSGASHSITIYLLVLVSSMMLLCFL